jgi:benzoyl-CoA reductase subunit BamB
MRCAETGFNLEIDLTRGNIERVATDPKETEMFMGGLGTNAKIMWDRVPPSVDAFSPENLLIFSAGLLVGTPATGANRTIVTSLSPQTRLMAFSMMGGFLGPELKFAGYDKLILRGKSPDLVYIWIHNNQVEIRDASHLKGKGAVETQTLIKQELNEPKAQVAAIGLAGENRIFYASIEHDRSSASRGGLGAVMGDKRVKAIAVRGTRDVYVARPLEFLELCREVRAYIEFRKTHPVPETPAINEYLGSPSEMSVHDEKFHANFGSWGNSRKIILDYWTDDVEKEWTETLESMRGNFVSCFNCPMQCAATVSPPGQPTYMMKCYSKMTYAMAAYSNLDFNLKIAQLATEYGVDAISCPQVIACALELLEWGFFNHDDVPGLPEDSEGRFYYLLAKIVHREGIGDLLADGLYYIEQKFGEKARPFTRNTIKRQEQVNAKAYTLNPIYFLMFATGEKIQITQIQGAFPQNPFSSRKVREKFTQDWFQVPDEKFKRYFEDWQRNREGNNKNPYYPTVKMSCEIVDWQERMHYIDDCLGTCAGLSSFHQKAPYHIHNFPKFISAATGMDMDENTLTLATTRIRTLVRAINVRRGLRRMDDRPPEDHWMQRIPELETKLLDEYYQLKGWNKDSIPTKASLLELGLGFVSEEFINMGILTDCDD